MPDSSATKLTALRAASPTILPSLLLCDFGNLEREIRRLEEAGARALHLDVMDGQFVPNLTYGMPIVEACRRLTDLPLDVHAMIADPWQYGSAMSDAGADVLTFHVEAVDDPAGVIAAIKGCHMGAGIALNPRTPLSAVESVVGDCDLALVMSVAAGFGGQAFDPVALEKLQQLRQAHPDLLLEVDGGINEATLADCRGAGADLFIVGSGIFRKDDYGAAMRHLSEAMRRPNST